MRSDRQRWIPAAVGFFFLLLLVVPAWAADPEIDQLLRSPVGKDWVTNGGNLTNQRHSTLTQINTTNVKQLKVYSGAPHGLCSTHKDQINADLLAFLTS